jgi:hypothetical protein
MCPEASPRRGPRHLLAQPEGVGQRFDVRRQKCPRPMSHARGRAAQQIMDSSAFERTFGIRPVPLSGTVDSTLAWYRALLAS